jgi:hypothetical protein
MEDLYAKWIKLNKADFTKEWEKTYYVGYALPKRGSWVERRMVAANLMKFELTDQEREDFKKDGYPPFKKDGYPQKEGEEEGVSYLMLCNLILDVISYSFSYILSYILYLILSYLILSYAVEEEGVYETFGTQLRSPNQEEEEVEITWTGNTRTTIDLVCYLI